MTRPADPIANPSATGVEAGLAQQSSLSNFDVFLFRQGTHTRLYERLGAHVADERTKGARFAVWAPNASRVTVVGDFNEWRADADPLIPQSTSGLKANRWARFEVDPDTMRTSMRGVFAGGDNVNGADLVVTAMADGRRASEAIHRYLESLP